MLLRLSADRMPGLNEVFAGGYLFRKFRHLHARVTATLLLFIGVSGLLVTLFAILQMSRQA